MRAFVTTVGVLIFVVLLPDYALAQASITGVVRDSRAVESTGAGQRPGVTFTVTDRKGTALEPSTLNRLAFTLGGPTTDYGDGLPTTGG